MAGWTPPRTPPAKGWTQIFAIYAGAGEVPPLLGSYSVEGGALVFHPQFPIAAGVRYRAVLRIPGAAPVERTFDGPPRDTRPMARVDAVYPTADVLPSNLLRFYLYFSAPMSQGEAGRRVHLLDDQGKDIAAVFLPGEELWDPAGRRLTMTLDPGRIKRGLTSNQAMGPPLATGRRYVLAIDKDWPDSRGVAMTEGFRKTFRGGPAERTRPDPKTWRITPPAAGSAAPVTIDFPKPMNYVLLQRMIHVAGNSGDVSGSIATARAESGWRFTPAAPWNAGAYRLLINTALEDLAGNSIALAFDIDVFDRVTQRIQTETMTLPFTVR